MSKPFKAPRKVNAKEESISIDESDSVSTTEEFSVEEDDTMFEAVFREQCKIWLDLNGKALFALEVSRFLAKERKNNNSKTPLVPRNGRTGTSFFAE